MEVRQRDNGVDLSSEVLGNEVYNVVEELTHRVIVKTEAGKRETYVGWCS